ncbi:MAG: ABC transporter ATP-binding protein [Deltaproteobacteria bacterium]
MGFAFGLLALIATQGFALAAPQLLRIATDALIASDSDRVIEAAFMLMGVAVLGGAARVVSRIQIFNNGRRVEYDLRNDIFAHLLRLPPAFYDKMPVGQVMSRMVNDLTQVRLLLGPGILNLTNTTLVYIVVIPLLFITDFWLTVYALLPLPVLLMLGRIFAKFIYRWSRESQDKLAILSSKVQENLSGVMTVRAYRQEGNEASTFLKMSEDYLDTNIKLARLRGTMFPMMGVAGAIGSLVVLWVGGHRIMDGQMTVGEFVGYNAYLAALTWPTIALGWMISLIQRGLAAMERVNEIFSAEPALVDGDATPAALSGRIELDDLTFAYAEGDAPALQNLTTTIEPGEMVVVVGRTGCGKSTLLEVLARLLEVERGQVRFDGVDVNDLPLAHVRDQIGYAPQDAFLFSRTLFENVAFGAPDASDEDVEEAVRLASFDGDVAGFSNGLETIVGERGVTLSGGQRQRTTLARALLVDPPILILDDTLSAVDTETETAILDALVQEKSKRTLVVATHRLAAAARADRILVLEHGKLVEQGTEAELLALDGVYAAMHRRQRLENALTASSPEKPAA